MFQTFHTKVIFYQQTNNGKQETGSVSSYLAPKSEKGNLELTNTTYHSEVASTESS